MSSYETNREIRILHEQTESPTDDGASTEMTALEPLELQQLAPNVLLPFSERHTEVIELLNAPCNSRLLSRLRQLGRWKELEELLKQTREKTADRQWVEKVEGAVANPSLWVSLRGMLGADDIDCDDRPDLLVSPLNEGEPIIRRPPSLESSVFLSDTESCFSLPLDSPPLFKQGSSPPKPSVRGSPIMSHSPLPREPVFGSPLRSPRLGRRHHTRALSHGGAIAAPAPGIETIHEDADPDAPDARRATSFEIERSPSMSSPPSKPLGLRIVTLLEPEDTPVGSPIASASVDKQRPLTTDTPTSPPRRRKSRYSFGSVSSADADGHGLGLTD